MPSNTASTSARRPGATSLTASHAANARRPFAPNPMIWLGSLYWPNRASYGMSTESSSARRAARAISIPAFEAFEAGAPAATPNATFIWACQSAISCVGFQPFGCRGSVRLAART